MHLPSVPGCGTRQARSVLTGPPAMVGRAGALGGLGRPPQRLGVAVSLGRTGGQQHRPRCRGQPFHSLFLQTQGSGPVTLELVIPFIKPEDCILVRNIGIHSPGNGTGCYVAALPLPHMRSWSSPWPSLRVWPRHTCSVLCGEVDEVPSQSCRNSLAHGDPLLHTTCLVALPWSRGWRPWLTGLGVCPQVWRSDVRFACKRRLCPDGEFLAVGKGGWQQKDHPHFLRSWVWPDPAWLSLSQTPRAGDCGTAGPHCPVGSCPGPYPLPLTLR